jgi:hypothetical protein
VRLLPPEGRQGSLVALVEIAAQPLQVRHAVEGRAEDAPGWWESWPALWCFMAVLVLIAGAMLAKC